MSKQQAGGGDEWVTLGFEPSRIKELLKNFLLSIFLGLAILSLCVFNISSLFIYPVGLFFLIVSVSCTLLALWKSSNKNSTILIFACLGGLSIAIVLEFLFKITIDVIFSVLTFLTSIMLYLAMMFDLRLKRRENVLEQKVFFTTLLVIALGLALLNYYSVFDINLTIGTIVFRGANPLSDFNNEVLGYLVTGGTVAGMVLGLFYARTRHTSYKKKQAMSGVKKKGIFSKFSKKKETTSPVQEEAATETPYAPVSEPPAKDVKPKSKTGKLGRLFGGKEPRAKDITTQEPEEQMKKVVLRNPRLNRARIYLAVFNHFPFTLIFQAVPMVMRLIDTIFLKWWVTLL